MVGGGRGAFIGAVHRMAATMDNQIELVCGALSADPARARQSGADWFLPPARCYATYEEMFRRERELPVGERMDFVCIVTPNHLHYPVARLALQSGFAVVCDKPLALNLREGRALAALVTRTGLPFALTHNYAGYALVKEARDRIARGALGPLRKIVVEYPQGWLADPLERSGQKQAAWRTDPARAGASCCLGDIGTHAAHLAEYVSGLPIESVCAELTTFVKGRPLEDDGSVLLRFPGGIRGHLWASQVAVGEENGLNLRVYGERGGLRWRQEEPNTLTLLWPDRPREIVRAGGNFADRLSPAALAASRLPAGHPEGYLEGFANIYRTFAGALRAHLAGRRPKTAELDFPTVADGVRGLAFIQAALASSKHNGR
ncbi:MAG: Gfo/Idh/MocA family oxidoreductase, partial [Candidatus Marinimicrobia bacterium]|nr:Gfo/Idh/MocA family oxidoreductase [Candidatus Neomarinimicrobiota bacterium]